MLKYQDHFDWSTNIGELAGAFAAEVRALEDRRARIETGPNHPELKANDLAAVDAQLGPARLRSQAAEDGVYLYDPRDVSGGDRDAQTWVAKARERGMLVNPSNFGPSLHDQDKDVPIKVVRGGDGARALGAPTITSR
ncbi:MAG: hypothetical protein ACLP9L_34315 [Thermoguttaceae bacterium]